MTSSSCRYCFTSGRLPDDSAGADPDTRTHPHIPARDAYGVSEGRSKEDGQEDSIAASVREAASRPRFGRRTTGFLFGKLPIERNTPSCRYLFLGNGRGGVNGGAHGPHQHPDRRR